MGIKILQKNKNYVAHDNQYTALVTLPTPDIYPWYVSRKFQKVICKDSGTYFVPVAEGGGNEHWAEFTVCINQYGNYLNNNKIFVAKTVSNGSLSTIKYPYAFNKVRGFSLYVENYKVTSVESFGNCSTSFSLTVYDQEISWGKGKFRYENCDTPTVIINGRPIWMRTIGNKCGKSSFSLLILEE